MAQGGTYARCAILTRSASEGNSFCRPRLRFLELRILGVMENWLCSC